MWTFEISSGRMFSPDGNVAGQGYSGGNLGKNPEGKNNPADESIPNVGPIPEGIYDYGYLVMQHPKLGHFCWPLIPRPGNQMYGRVGLWEHGDTTPAGFASEGCVVQPFPTRKAQWDSPDHVLQVVALFGDLDYEGE